MVKRRVSKHRAGVNRLSPLHGFPPSKNGKGVVGGGRRKRPVALLLKKRLSQHQNLSLILDNQDSGHAKIPAANVLISPELCGLVRGYWGNANSSSPLGAAQWLSNLVGLAAVEFRSFGAIILSHFG